jgi:ESS family glutamate:Na+ symporter
VVYVTNLFSKEIFPGLGWLVPSGFAQGPGQAVALATVWEKGFKIPDAISFGLTFAAVGFFIASLVGVALANWGVRKGLPTHAPKELPREFLVGLHDDDKRADAGKLTTHSGNIDGMAFQVAILIATYFLTYYACLGLKAILPASLKAIAFGLMFFWGMIIALIIRWILIKLKLVKYIDNNVQRRITGVAVDYMVVATLMAVKVAAVWANIVPITLMCLTAGVFTFYFLLYFGRRQEEYSFERFIALFGIGTGTAASGLLLLRIVDPEFKTPVASEVGLMNLPLLLIIPLSFISFTLPQFGVGKGLIVLAVLTVIMMVLLKVLKMWKKPAW